MSYSIIFETKIVKLTDGRILHLDLSGCNNDTAGRNRGDFTGKIYTTGEFEELIKPFNGKSDDTEGFNLKIGNKPAKWSDYRVHLMRMLKRAKSIDDFRKERLFIAERYDGVKLNEPEERMLTPKEFSEYFYDLLYSGKPFSYERITTTLNSESEIVETLENGQAISFYVGRKRAIL